MWWFEAMCSITHYIQQSICVFSLPMGLEVKECSIVVQQLEGAHITVTLFGGETPNTHHTGCK